MRIVKFSAATLVSVLVVGAAYALPDGDASVQRTSNATGLSARLSVVLSGLCGSGTQAQMLDSIESEVAGFDIEATLGALQALSAEGGLCEEAEDAVEVAERSAQLALSGEEETTNTSQQGTVGKAPFTGTRSVGIGAPGGGGGPGYIKS